MIREEIRREEDYAEAKGLELCDLCTKKKTTSCRHCAHNYADMFELAPVFSKLREAINGTQD